MFRHAYQRLIFIEILLDSTFCWKASFCPAGLCYLCAFWATGVCVVHCLSLFHILSLCVAAICWKWLTERVLFHLTYNTPQTLCTTLTLIFLWAYINNYTAPVLLIIVVSAQQCVFCCCQEMRIGMSSDFLFLFFFEQSWSQIQQYLGHWSNWQENSVICWKSCLTSP